LENEFLKKPLLTGFLETLRRFGELHGPVISEEGVASFAALGDSAALRLDYGRTLIPPKKYLIPFREEILHYHDGTYRQSTPQPPEIVLFGIHPCDLQGIAYLDLVFLGDRPDPSYAARRDRLILVGVSCEPDNFCFGSGPSFAAPCDLFLTSREDGFELAAFTPKGKAVVAAAKDLLVQAPPAPQENQVPCAVIPQDPQLRFSDNPLWERFAQTCVSCGACSVCCPTCYCFDVREYPDLSGGGTRLREWDNCLFVTHGEVAGANFRTTRLDRLRYRFLHKYCGFTPLDGMTSCVGCGRCKAACPVGIDLRELTQGCENLLPRLP
jgi:formate hydrogenlyase subunit 6/NADH:ubiquinone oxidoreductase subunit I